MPLNSLVAKAKQEIFPSALFECDSEYLDFLDELLIQTEQASINPKVAFFIGANEMMKKKILHDFLMETKRRALLKRSRKKTSK